MAKMEPEEFTLDRTDKLRAEIESKITACDNKIDQRVTYTSFHWTVGSVIAVAGTSIAACYLLLYKLYDNEQSIKDRILVVETQLNTGKKLH